MLEGEGASALDRGETESSGPGNKCINKKGAEFDRGYNKERESKGREGRT